MRLKTEAIGVNFLAFRPMQQFSTMTIFTKILIIVIMCSCVGRYDGVNTNDLY